MNPIVPVFAAASAAQDRRLHTHRAPKYRMLSLWGFRIAPCPRCLLARYSHRIFALYLEVVVVNSVLNAEVGVV
jgi:hypothetical protein